MAVPETGVLVIGIDEDTGQLAIGVQGGDHLLEDSDMILISTETAKEFLVEFKEVVERSERIMRRQLS
jgi:DNA integrity scanning protein DisA with diadenylate cyclase activity